MAQPLSTSLACATAVLRRCGFPSLTVVRVGPIGGGMVSRVEEWLTDGEPRAAIAKSSPNAADEGLLREWRTLRWMRETTDFPSPVPYGCVADDEAGDGTYLLMERLPGAHLGAARVSAAGWHLLQDQLGSTWRAYTTTRARPTGWSSTASASRSGSTGSRLACGATTRTPERISLPPPAGILSACSMS